MPRATIAIPQRTDLDTMLRFGQELDYFAMHDKLTLDFNNQAMFFSPFYMLFLSSKLRSLKIKNEDLIIEVKNHPESPYPGRMGFFHMFGVEHGRRVGEAWGSDTYLPITRVERHEFYEAPVDKYVELPDLIQRHADRIASVMAQDKQFSSTMYDVLSFSVREVMRNVFEHSQSTELYYCANYWPKSNKVEFAIADFGIGIRKGLGENPNFRFPTDKQAIEYSLMPSVSGKTHLPRMSETWFNSGYGLYMTSRLARNGGNFVIASGSTAVQLSQRTKTNYPTSFPGTALRFNLDVEQIGNVSDRLQEFRKEGYAIAKEISGSGNRPPSAMSLLLRRDYRR